MRRVGHSLACMLSNANFYGRLFTSTVSTIHRFCDDHHFIPLPLLSVPGKTLTKGRYGSIRLEIARVGLASS